jgi:hypothetical protein
MGTVAAVAGGLAMLLLLVIGFVVLAKGDKHTPGTNALRPIGAATKVRLESELRSATAAQTMYLAEHGRYAATQQELATTGFAASPTADVSIVGVSAQDFCMSAADRAGKTRVYYSRSGGMSSTPCSAG